MTVKQGGPAVELTDPISQEPFVFSKLALMWIPAGTATTIWLMAASPSARYWYVLLYWAQSAAMWNCFYTVLQ